MDSKTLTQIGLNETQAEAYIQLVKNGSLSPPELSELTSEKRTNAYAVLDQLIELGLAKKKEINKKFRYFAENPVALEQLAKNKRTQALETERKVHASLPTLMNFFHTFSDQPGIRFYQGLDGIKEIYNDMLRTCRDIYLIRSQKDQDLLTLNFYDRFKKKRAELGIKTHMLNPSTDTTAWNSELDKKFNIDRTNISTSEYSANVEVSIYGNKVSLISFGEEAFGTIIESPQIALAMKQIFELAKKGTTT